MNVVQSLNGVSFDIDSLPQALAYNASNKIDHIDVVYRTKTYRQTFTYTAGNLTSISGWVEQ